MFNFGDTVYVLLKTESYYEGNVLNATGTHTIGVYLYAEDAVKEACTDAGDLLRYAYSLGTEDKDVVVERCLSSKALVRYMIVKFPEDRGHKEIRKTTWTIEERKLQ